MAESDVSRRDFLKRGAALGGAMIWATPVIQIVGMRPALASHTSPPICDVVKAVKIEILESEESPCGGARRAATGIADEYCCEDIAGEPPTDGDCRPATYVAESGGCDHIASVHFADEFNWEITFTDDCFYLDGMIALKAGAGCGTPLAEYDPATRTLTITKQGETAPAISHVEFQFCCEDH
jgi:hypothetical protein